MRAVTAIISSNKPQNSLYPVYVRLTHLGQRAYYNTGVYVKKTHWNAKAKDPERCVRDTAPDADEIKAKLLALVQMAKAIWQDALKAGTVLTMPELMERLRASQLPELHKPDVADAFWPVADAYVDSMPMPQSSDTMRARLAPLRSFAPNLCFSEIKPLFLTKYQNYLFKLGQAPNTVIGKMKAIRTVCNRAVEYGIISSTPYRHKLPKKTQKPAIYLTENELKALSAIVLPPGIQSIARDVFMLGYYAHGIRVSDRIMLTWAQIDGQYIRLNAIKNKTAKNIAINSKLAEILLRYDNKGKYVFPIGQDATNLRTIDTTISRATARINKALKAIAKKLEIDKPLTTHMARHTLANQLMRKGGSVELIAGVLGNDIEATKTYMGTFPQEDIDAAVLKVYGL